VDELLADVGDARFALAGASFGSVVVQEMARQLELVGRSPELLVMFDCRVPRPRRKVGPVRRLAGRLRHPSTLRYRSGGDTQTRIRREVLASHEARRNHPPQAISVPTLMFTSAAKRTDGDPLLGWGPFLRGSVSVVEFPGEHLELIRDRAQDTGRALDRALKELDHDRPQSEVLATGRPVAGSAH
jgi:thioesterase domain-containing protein